MSEALKGVLAIALASSVWGLSGLYYKALAHVPALEILAHRTIWSVVFFFALLAWQGRLSLVPRLLASKEIRLVFLAALMISANWFIFIHSIQIGMAVEASLGYFIFPLVAVLLGAVGFGERLGRAQWVTVLLAFVAVLVLTIGLGAAPWIALVIAGTFGAYGFIKRRIPSGPVVSVATEVSLLAPLALAWLVGVHAGYVGAGGGAFGRGWHDTVLLIFSGIITGGPLMLMSYATKRVRLATVGLIQYINPSLQFLVATFIFVEPVTLWHVVAFALIWTGLAIYSISALKEENRRSAVVVGA
ncbi:MAG: EamA family transporter RarD [Rhodobacteraceae bacterium]|nr:EamA family transporter RarD [Paracoccaceae bacterium]MCP5340866.1 EamA family transporter RarD [Paracoccaceae bacterium]